MNFKQAPLNRATIISHFSAGTSESARRTNVSEREDGKEREIKNTGEREREREREGSDGDRQQHREPLVRLYDE